MYWKTATYTKIVLFVQTLSKKLEICMIVARVRHDISKTQNFMKKIFTLSLTLFVAVLSFAQTTSIFGSFAILSLNGGANAYYDMQSATGNPDFQGANLGNYNASNSIVMKGGQNKTNKCSGGNVTGSNLFYRVWLTSAGASGAFTSISEGFFIK